MNSPESESSQSSPQPSDDSESEPATLRSYYLCVQSSNDENTNRARDGYGCRRRRACQRLARVSSSHLGGRGLV